MSKNTQTRITIDADEVIMAVELLVAEKGINFSRHEQMPYSVNLWQVNHKRVAWLLTDQHKQEPPLIVPYHEDDFQKQPTFILQYDAEKQTVQFDAGIEDNKECRDAVACILNQVANSMANGDFPLVPNNTNQIPHIDKRKLH